MALILNILLATFYLIMTDPKIMLSRSQQVPCLYFFGDSGFDNGNNNNFLFTVFKANYPPYGVDYPGGPTGRFSNGMNKADYLAQLLGFNKTIPPFLAAQSSELLQGVNYASGGAGIRVETGRHLGFGGYNLYSQLANHRFMTFRVSSFFGFSTTRADAHLNKCLYALYIGSDDYIRNYFLPQLYYTSRQFTPEQFAESLIQEYSRHLKTLYDYGARKVAIFGLGLLGCLPQMIVTYPTHASPCVEPINNAARLFNSKLRPLVDFFNNNLNGAQFIYINTSGIDVSLDDLGFNLTNPPCCQVSRDGVCIRNQAPCVNRRQTLFFDNLHPVDVLNEAIATRAYRSRLPTDAYPYDIRTLALTNKLQNNINISLSQSVWSQK